MYLSNENRGTTNYTCSSKPKKVKLSEQKEKEGKKKDLIMKVIKKSKKWRSIRYVEENIMEVVDTWR